MSLNISYIVYLKSEHNKKVRVLFKMWKDSGKRKISEKEILKKMNLFRFHFYCKRKKYDFWGKSKESSEKQEEM